MKDNKYIEYEIATQDGKRYGVKKSDVEKYGWAGYAKAFPGAKVRMRDNENRDYSVPIEKVDYALGKSLRPFTMQTNVVKYQQQSQATQPKPESIKPTDTSQSEGSYQPTFADAMGFAETLGNVGGTLYQSEQSRKQLGQPFKPSLDVERATFWGEKPDNIGKRYNKAVEKMTFGPDVENSRQQLEDDIKNDLVESRREDSKATTYNPYTGTSAMRSQKTANLEAASAFLDSADMIQKAATAEGGWYSGLARGVRDAFRDPATLTFGLSSADQYRSVFRAINKMEKGEQLSKDEQTLLDAAAYNMYVAATNNPNLSTAYTVGKGAAESLPFMVEFFVSPISGVGKKAAKELAEYTVKKYAGKAIGKYLTGGLAKTAARKAGKFALGAAANVVPASAMALTTSAPRTVGGMYERMVGEVKPEVAADMRTIVYGGHEGENNVGKALAKSYASTTIENWSEFLGDQFGDILPAVGKLFGRTKIGTRIMDTKAVRSVTDFMDKVNKTDLAKTIKDIEETVQFNGTFGEFAEEVAGGIANAIVVGDQELNAGERGVFNPDNLIQTYLTCAVIGAVPAGLRLTGYAASKLSNNKLKAADAAAGKAMGDSWPQMREQILNASNEARADYLKQVVTSPVFSAEDKKAVLIYVGEVAKREAAEEFKRMKKDDPAYSAYDNKRDIINNYNEVSSAIGEEKKANLDFYSDYREWSANNRNASGEEKEDAKLYFSAREDMYKYVDEMNARIRNRVDARMQEINNLTNPDTGEVITVRSNYYQQPVNIVGGRLAFDESGNVDAKASDKIIYYVDNNGKRMMATPDKFTSLVSRASAADMRQQVQQEEEAGAWAEEEVEMSQPEIKTGSEVITPDGRQGIVTEVGSDYLVVKVDGQYIAYDPSEVSIPTPMQAETLQQPVAGQPSQVEQPQAQQQEGMAGTTPQQEVQPAAQAQPGEVQQTEPQIPSGQIPQDEKGDYMFTQVPAEQTYAYLYTQEDITPEEAGMIVDQNIQEAQKRIEKLTSNGPKVTPNINEFRANKAKWEAEKQRAQADLDYWNQVKAIGEAQSKPSEEQPEQAEQVEPVVTVEAASIPETVIQTEVPDVTNDRAEDARNRGYRLVNSIKIERQEPIETKAGSDTEVTFSSKDRVPAKFAVIESDALQPSHISGQRNHKFFIDEAQPKDRVDEASINAETQIAANINPEEITTGVTAYVGSPVVNSRGEVIQGNNRSAGLKQMYNGHSDQSQKYKDYLIQNAQKFGLNPADIESMNRPVLVRMLDINDNEAIRLGNLNAQDTESGGFERIKPQQAVGRLGNRFQSFMRILLSSTDEDASYSEVINSNAVDALKFLRQQDAISDTQYQSAFDDKGNVTVEAKEDLRAMAEASLFEGGPTMLPQAFAMLPNKAKKAILQTFMRDANSTPEAQIKTDIQNAIMLFREAIQFQEFADAKTYDAAKKALNTFSLQGDIFNDNRTPGDRYDDFAFELAARFKGNTQKRMVQDFNEYYNMVQGEGATLFNPDVTETSKNEAVKKLYNIDIKEDGTETENDMAGDTESSQDGGQRSETDDTVGESDETGEQPAESGAGTESDVTEEAKPATFEQIKERALSVPGVTVFEEVTAEDGSKGIKVGNKKSTTTYWYDDLSGENGKEELDFLNKQLQKYKDSHSENEMLSKVKDASDFYEYLKKKGEADPKRGVAGYDIKMYVSQAKEALSNERYMKDVSIPIVEYIVSEQWKGKESITTDENAETPGIQDDLDDLENDMMEAGSEYDAAVEDNVGVEEARQKYKDAFYVYWSRTGLSEAEINDKWSRSETETKQEQSKTDELTVDEINGTDFEQELKDYAIDYINGIRTIHAQTAYKQIYDYVRNRPRSNESDSQPADGTQLDGRIDESERGGSRQGGEQTEPVDRGTSEENVSGEPAGVSDGKGSTAVPDGTEGGAEVSGEESANDGVSAGTPGRKGGRRTGSKGDNVRTRKGGRRSKSDTQVIPEPISETESERDSLLDELYGLLDDFTKAGKGELSVSVVGMNSKQIEILSKIVVVSAKIGYTYIKEGVYKFQQWSEVMKDKFTSKTPLASVLNFTDADVDQFISDTWNSNFTLNGERRPLREWAAMMEKEELRKKVRSTLEEKREAQQKAEGIEVKIGDRANISETLPFLLPEQQEDVMRAETQFFDESHNDRDHAFGKGYLFTNGTGTGKTYTGLGIVKRFVKQGKGRVLILTPSQAKVSDWANDGKNLGLDITPLESTKDKGTGVVITTFANFRSNKALFEDVFDLVVYDESHRIMENKEGARTTGVTNHFMITNKNKKEALERMKKVHPLWIEEGELLSEQSGLLHMMSDLDMMQEEYTEKDSRVKEIDKRLEEIRKEQEKVLPEMEKEAEEAAKRTKVVFLSATPFNTIKSLDYAEGYIFSYPEEDQSTIGAYRHRSPREEFLEKNFGAGFRFRYGRIEEHIENAEALSQQEVQFSDYLENTLGTKSGRIIDSEYDYSRDFPTVTFEFAPMFNGALEDIYLGDKELRPLSDIASGIFNDYNYSTALFETMKVSAITPRIKEHLAKGRKVVIFHRRVSSKEPLQPPFAYMLDAAESIFNNMDTTTEEGKKQKKAIRNAIDKFRQKYDRLLKYEQTLNYKLPRVQIADEFGAENVLFFSGQESKKVKNEAISQFNDDNSGKNIIVIQEESGKEGISLHDTTGNNQRVLISLALPQSPITALQIEGRIYRIGNKSNAIFEYPLLGLNQEINLFAQKFNQRVSTTENLALGSLARNLRASFADGVIDSSGDVPLDYQGVGGKERDNAGKTEGTDYDKAILDFYGTQKITGTRDSRDGKDFYPTPEPVGFKMVEWARIQEGEDVLEPSAGMGAIARYVPKNSSLTAIEPSQKLFPTLQLKAGGFGRKFIMDIFENLNIVNKYDAILMNPPFGAAGSTAIAHVDKAFKHLNEGGRIVALIPRGSTDKKFDKWIQENESAKMVGEVILPSVTFTRAGTSVNTRVVIIDKITREELRNKAPMMKRVDLSYAKSLENEDGLFEALRDITMPPRTIDQQMIDQKNAKKTMKTFKDIEGVFDASIKDNGVSVYGRYYGMNFEESFESMKSPEVYMTYKNRLDNISSRSRHSKRDDASIQFLETVLKTIENVSGKTGEQIMDSLPKNEGGIKMSDKYKYVLDMHSKTGADMHLAKPIVEGSLSNEEYTAISRLAKKHGGYWNRTKKAFHFDSAEQAEAFINDSVEVQQVRYRIEENDNEIESIISSAKANGTYMKAPNGNPTNLTEGQWAQVRTKAFKDWFGDWINNPSDASKVVDENGEPMVVDDVYLNLRDNNPIPSFFSKIERLKKKAEKIKELEKEIGYSWDDREFLDDERVMDFFEYIAYSAKNTYAIIKALKEGKAPVLRVAFRYGHINEDQMSYNYRDQVFEQGVSVVGRVADLNTEEDPYYNTFFGSQPYNVVLGVDFGYKGADGEMLLTPAVVLGTAKKIGKIAKSAVDNTGEFSSRKPDIRFSIKRKENLSSQESDRLKEDIKSIFRSENISESKAVEGLRKLGILNASTYKGYGRISDEQAEYNNSVYKLKDDILKKAVSLFEEKGWDVGVDKNEGVVFFRDSDGIQISFHTRKFPEEWKDLPERSWDMVPKSYSYNPDRYSQARDYISERYNQWKKDVEAYQGRIKDSMISYLRNSKRRSSLGIEDSYEDIKNKISSYPSRIDSSFNFSDAELISSPISMPYTSREQVVKSVESEVGDKPKKFNPEEEVEIAKERFSIKSSYDVFAEVKKSGMKGLLGEPLIKPSDKSHADAIDEISSKVGYSVSTVTGDQISGPDSDIKRKAKAWYDPNTDTVTINLDNVVSVEDAQRSYLHEVVGHYGLRELFGEQFDDIMFKIYGLLPKNVQEEIQAYMLSNYSSQLAKISSAKDAVVLSMEEYLSRKAEENPDASWWDRICGSIRNLFRSIGIGIKFNDNDVRYILWRSKNNLNKGRNVDFGKPMPQYDQPRFRMEENATINEEELKGESVMEQAEIIATTIELDKSERENFERRIKNTRIREGWQDRMIAVKRFQEKISEVTGKVIKSWENAYDYENTIASRSQYYIDEFKEKMMKPIYASISKLGDQNKVRDYLKAKHGLERNQKMREREVQKVKDKLEAELKIFIDQWNEKVNSAKDKDKAMSEMQAAVEAAKEKIEKSISRVIKRESKKDYSGLTGLYKRLYDSKESTPIKDIESKFREFVSTYESEHKEYIEELWNNIRSATNYTLDFLHDTNILSREMLEKIMSQYEYYVPLREWQEKKADQEFEYFSDHISDAFTDPLKKAEGRTSESGDPVASILNMAQSSIFIGHKNMMKLHSLRMVRNHRTNLANISSLWYVKNEDGEWEEVAADLDGTETYEEAQAKIASFEEKMKAKKELGLATRKKSSLNLGMPIKKWQARQHEIRVKELGQEYIIYINTDPRIAQAINGLNNINLSARKYAKPINKIKTFMAASYTARNVAFIVRNVVVDALFSLTNSFIKEGAAYSGKFVSSLGKSFTDLGAYIWKGKASPELEVFLKNGGETGFVSMLSYEESMKEVQKGVGKYKKTLLVKDFFSVLGMVIERINRHVEALFRYGIFLASRKSGKNVSESVKDAKEITVNFNRKGSGAYGSAYANMAYLFLNAGIQGLNNTVETAKKNKTRALIAYSFWAGLGYLIPALMCGDDDDCLYDDIPDFIRRQNICFPTGKNGYITIPLPVEIRTLYSLGDMVYMYNKGKYKGSETDLAADLFGTLMTLMPKDFISGGNYELDYPKSIFFNAMPDWIKPITDTYMVNTTWTGRPIKKETPYNKYVPEYRKVYRGTNEYLVEASKFINKISGGNYAEKGSLDGPLNNPASLEYLIQQYMGGAARTYYQGILSTIRAIDPDKEVATKDVPVVNRFYKSVNTDRPMTNISERYFDYVEISKEYESQKREYKRGLKEGEDLSGDFEEFMRNNKESISTIINGSSDAIQQLNTVRPFLNEEDEKELDKEIYKIQKDAVDQIDKLKK